jgi:hypothetical protein
VELERSASRTLWQESARMESATRNIVSDIALKMEALYSST